MKCSVNITRICCEIEEGGNMNKMSCLVSVAAVFIVMITACTKTPESIPEQSLVHFPLDDMQDVITRDNVEIDKADSSDGNGSLKVSAAEPVTVRLYELHGTDVENARLLYRAKVRTKGLNGKVYLEMWVHLAGKGEFFTRNVHTAASGTTGWLTMEAPFFLKKGQNPDYLKLNLVIEGTGTAWIDDIRVDKAALQ